MMLLMPLILLDYYFAADTLMPLYAAIAITPYAAADAAAAAAACLSPVDFA